MYLIPVIVFVITYIFFHHRIAIIEAVIQLTVPFLVCFLMATACKSCTVLDQEYWGSYVTKVVYEEDWNERVSCRHPKYCTRTVTDSDGRSHTEEYQCGWEHPYDVDYHPERWYYKTNIGERIGVSKHEYNRLRKLWNNEKFVDMHRYYHSIDGDAYHTLFDGLDHHLRPITSIHNYVNKVAHSDNVMNFPEVIEESANALGLHSYTNLKDNLAGAILGGGTSKEREKFNVINAKYGSSKQIRVWVLIYEDKPFDIVQDQINYWKNGNKNELVICIGRKARKVQWVDIFSWSESDQFLIDLRYKLEQQIGERLDLLVVGDWLEKNIHRWKRKEFKDFEYLDIELTNTQYGFSCLFTLFVSCGLAVFFVGNEENSNLYVFDNFVKDVIVYIKRKLK